MQTTVEEARFPITLDEFRGAYLGLVLFPGRGQWLPSLDSHDTFASPFGALLAARIGEQPAAEMIDSAGGIGGMDRIATAISDALAGHGIQVTPAQVADFELGFDGYDGDTSERTTAYRAGAAAYRALVLAD
jgi:hypothetical protein